MCVNRTFNFKMLQKTCTTSSGSSGSVVSVSWSVNLFTRSSDFVCELRIKCVIFKSFFIYTWLERQGLFLSNDV